MNNFIKFLTAILLLFFVCCNSSNKTVVADVAEEAEYVQTVTAGNWKDELTAEIPLLGHRNWIVVADMAYPLQTQAGIKTVYIDAHYNDILRFVYEQIEQAPHIKANIYQDKELTRLDENDAEGVTDLKLFMKQLLGEQVKYVLHDELIARLDEVSRMFNVIILKSTLTIPYTTTFFELDCSYWTGEKEKALRNKMK